MTLSLRTQQIIALESGVARTVDPLAGSYFVERLTDDIEAAATATLAELDAAGGAVAAIERGVPQRWIAESAYRIEREIADGVRPKVGVNVYEDDAGAEIDAGAVPPRRGGRRTPDREDGGTDGRARPEGPRGGPRGARRRDASGRQRDADADRRVTRRARPSARWPTSSARSSGSSGSRTRGDRAARGPPRPGPHAVRRGVAGHRDARDARRRGDQDRGPAGRRPVPRPRHRAGRRPVGAVHVAERREAERGAGHPRPGRGRRDRAPARALRLPGGERAAGEPGALRPGLGVGPRAAIPRSSTGRSRGTATSGPRPPAAGSI